MVSFNKSSFEAVALKGIEPRTIFVALLFAVISLILHAAYYIEMGWGNDLRSAYFQSDAFFYFYHSWFEANIHSSGGMLTHIISPSIYHHILTFIFEILGSSVLVAYSFSACCTALAVFVGCYITQELFEDHWTTIVSGILFSFCGAFIFYSGLLMKTSFVLFEVSLFIWLAIVAIKTRSYFYFSCAVLLAVATSYDRENALILAVVFCMIFFLMIFDHLSQIRRYTVSLVSTIIALIVARFVLGLALGDSGLVNSVGVNFLAGNAPGADGNYVEFYRIENNIIGHRLGLRNYLEEKLGESPTALEYQIAFMGDWIDYYSRYPLEFLVLKLKHISNLFSQFSIGYPESYAAHKFKENTLILAFVDWALVFAFSSLGLYCAKSKIKCPQIWQLICFSLFAYSLSIMFFLVTERYRLILFILMIPMASLGIRSFFFLDRKRGATILVLSVFVISVALNYLPFRSDIKNRNNTYEKEEENRVVTSTYYELMEEYSSSKASELVVPLINMMLKQEMYYDVVCMVDTLALNNTTSSAYLQHAKRAMRNSKRRIEHSVCENVE